MKFLGFLVCFALLAARADVVAQAEADGLRGLVVPVDAPSEKRDAGEKVMKAALAGRSGQAALEPVFVVTESGQGVLWGDLFKTGGCFALVELAEQNEEDPEAGGVAFAEWAGGSWQLRGLWDIPVTWRPKGWKEGGDDYLPATPAVQPFWLEDLSGEGTPEVVFAGEVGKYFQQHYLLRFIPQTGGLNIVATAMAPPARVEEYVRLYTDSGRRSIWEEWQFCRWEADALKPVASWHAECGYNENDPSFSEGMRIGRDGQATTIRVLYGPEQESDGGGYQLTRDGKPFGTMHVVWKDSEHPPANAELSESAWLFEKTTGLPRRLFPEADDAKSVPKFEDLAHVTVEGDDDAARLFGAGR